MLRFPAARTAAPAKVAKAAGAVGLAAGAALALTGCAAARATCVVRHRMAIVIFQNGVGNYAIHHVTSFRLTVRYGPEDAYSRIIWPDVVLHGARGGNAPLVVRAYRAGPAVSCRADQLRGRQQ